jgi:hypothetical protein
MSGPNRSSIWLSGDNGIFQRCAASAPIGNDWAVWCIAVVGMLTACLPVVAQDAEKAKSDLEKLPNVVAVVNGQTITRDKLAQECLRRYGPLVLDNLLNKHLIMQACQAKDIKITQADVNEEINREANKFGLTTKLFLQAIEEERDVTPEQYASEIVWPMLALRALAADKIAVSKAEIDSVIQSEYAAYPTQ